MFSTKDATVYNLANSFDKLDQLGNTYFPQLGGLLLKANELIYTIYGIQPFQHYKISQTPTNSNRSGGYQKFYCIRKPSVF